MATARAQLIDVSVISLENQYRQVQRDYEQLAPPTLVLLDGHSQ
jgi:hypothetical protein